MNRRMFLSLVGGGVIVAAGGTLATVATRFPDKAVLPWSKAGSAYSEPRKKALSYAILAPNPHNRQPWLVDLSSPGQVVLTVDTGKLLPHTDPLNRQITIGLGCFLEVMSMAAAADGYRVDLELFPDGADETALDERPVAVATFVEDAGITPDPLFAGVLERRSLKEPYDLTRPVSSDVLSRIKLAAAHGNYVDASNKDESVKALRMLTHEALDIELDTPRTLKESVDLFRIGKAEIEANPDGIDFSGPFFETLHFVGAMTREGSLDTSSMEFSEGKKTVFAQTDTAMAHLWIVSPQNRRVNQIAAGRDWVRLHLAATAEGVGVHPLSQALQEFDEMKEHYERVHSMLAVDGGTVQMLARLGYAADVPPSPRWPLEAKIVKG